MQVIDLLGHDIHISGGISESYAGTMIQWDDKYICLQKRRTRQFISLPYSYSVTHREHKCEKCRVEGN